MGRERNWEHPQIPECLRGRVADLADRWIAERATSRIWERDSDLWTGGDESQWLGWLDITRPSTELLQLAQQITEEHPKDVLLLGMGGSGLGSVVLEQVLSAEPNAPNLVVIDTTDADEISDVLQRVDCERIVVIAASKSGSTLETSLLTDLFEARVPAQSCLAITDPESALVLHARARGYLATVLSPPSVGGRFSVLSPFGLVPALLSRRDLDGLLSGAEEMASSCRRADPLENPGVSLGLSLAAARQEGFYKIGIRATGSWSPFGLWLEQMLGESLGKRGDGLVPIRHWPEGAPDVLPVHVGPFDPADSESGACEPIAIHCSGAARLGAEFFRWQFATAVCGAALGVHPFDQPDVESAKVATRQVLEMLPALEGTDAPSLFEMGGLLSTGAKDVCFTSYEAPQNQSAEERLEAFLDGVSRQDYIAILDFLPKTSPLKSELGEWVEELARERGLCVAYGEGPRYLHSTGQVFKGGPARGHFLFLAADNDNPLAVPEQAQLCPGHVGRRFSSIRLAQAAGDAMALAGKGRPVLALDFSHVDDERARELIASVGAVS